MNLSKVAVTLFWIIIGYLLLQFFSPLNVNSFIHPYNKIPKFFPQGWGFFTRTPQEELIKAYHYQEGKWVGIANGGFSKENLFGLSRNNRENLMEVGSMYENLNAKDWFKGSGDPLSENYLDTIAVDTLTVRDKESFDRQFKVIKRGQTYCFIKHKPVPFAWSNKNQDKYNIYETIKIFIR